MTFGLSRQCGIDAWNDYCFVFQLRGGRMHQVREYMDTLKGTRMIFASPDQREARPS